MCSLISIIGAFVLLAAMLVFGANILTSRRRGAMAGDNPWEAWTLEWATSSPPPVENFDVCVGMLLVWHLPARHALVMDHPVLRAVYALFALASYIV